MKRAAEPYSSIDSQLFIPVQHEGFCHLVELVVLKYAFKKVALRIHLMKVTWRKLKTDKRDESNHATSSFQISNWKPIKDGVHRLTPWCCYHHSPKSCFGCFTCFLTNQWMSNQLEVLLFLRWNSDIMLCRDYSSLYIAWTSVSVSGVVVMHYLKCNLRRKN